MIAVVARDATTNMVIIPAVVPQLLAQKGSGTLHQIDGVMVCTVSYKSITFSFLYIINFYYECLCTCYIEQCWCMLTYVNKISYAFMV